MSVATPATHPQLPPSDASARPPPPRRPPRSRWLIGGIVLCLPVFAVAVLVAGDQLDRSSEAVTASDAIEDAAGASVVTHTETGDTRFQTDADASGALRARTSTGRVSIEPVASESVLPPATAAGETATPASASGLGSPEELEEFLDDVMADHFDRFALAGASVTVVKDGERWVSKGYGHADVAAGTPVEADATLFPTASVAKLFTWTAVMQLVEQGELDLDAEVNSYLSAFQVPDNFDEPVRVRHLLSHTAGFEDKPMSLAVHPEDLTDLETALIDDMPSQDWEPGRYTAYNNYSAGLAGYLVAEVSGMSWEDYVDRNILQPLSMTRTSTRQPTRGNVQPGMTKVYNTSADGDHTEARYEIVSLAPFGGMVATTQDVASFMLAHLRQGGVGEARILQEATAQRMHGQLFTHDPRLAGNAHGFWESTEHGQRILSHGGDHNTSMTWLWLLPEHDLGVYVAYNSVGGFEARGELWSAFLDYGFPTGPPAPAEPAATPADIEQFAGAYGPNRISSTTPAKLWRLLGVMTVSLEDGYVVTDVAGYGSQRWTPAGENRFTSVDGRSRMVLSEDGEHVFFDGPHTGPYSQLGAWAPIAWYDRGGLHGGLLAASMLLILSALVLWPVLSIVRRRRKTARPRSAGVARWWAAATGGLYLLSVVLAVVALLDYLALEYGASPLFVAALTLAIAATVLTLGAVVHTILAWRNRHWSVAGRVHYTLVTLAFVTLVWQLNHWNLLGFHA